MKRPTLLLTITLFTLTLAGCSKSGTPALTWVLTKEGNIWQIVHVHMSSVSF